MENRIVFDGTFKNIDCFDAKSNTFTIENRNDEYFYFDFDNYVPQNLKIQIINSNVTIIETYIGKLPDVDIEIDIDNKSFVSRFSIVVETKGDYKVNRKVINHGYYKSMQIDLTEDNVESVENINLENQEADALVIDGIYATKNSKKTYQTNLNHNVSSCNSKAQIFAINNDEANVSIYTDAYIKNKAIGTKTTQEGRIINLSDKCFGIVLPNLHIDENDVEASHSCSVGSLNQDHMYYLESRGLSEAEARNVLIRGYFNPIIEGISQENIRKHINEVLDKRIG